MLFRLKAEATPKKAEKGSDKESDRVASAFRRKIFLAGLILGIQTLNRPNILIAAIGVALVMLLVTRRVRPAALLVIGLLPAWRPRRSATPSSRDSGRSSRHTAG